MKTICGLGAICALVLGASWYILPAAAEAG
jgi:hypothetical protein